MHPVCSQSVSSQRKLRCLSRCLTESANVIFKGNCLSVWTPTLGKSRATALIILSLCCSLLLPLFFFADLSLSVALFIALSSSPLPFLPFFSLPLICPRFYFVSHVTFSHSCVRAHTHVFLPISLSSLSVCVFIQDHCNSGGHRWFIQSHGTDGRLHSLSPSPRRHFSHTQTDARTHKHRYTQTYPQAHAFA